MSDQIKFECPMPVWTLILAGDDRPLYERVAVLMDAENRKLLALFTDEDLAVQCLERDPVQQRCNAARIDDSGLLLALMVVAGSLGATEISLDWNNKPGFQSLLTPLGPAIHEVARARLMVFGE